MKKKKTQVEEIKDVKPRRRKRVGARREKGGALVMKIKQSQHSDDLTAMRSGAELMDLEADVRSIRRTRTGEIILELKRDQERKDAAYASLAEEVHSEGVEVRVLTAEATLKMTNLDDVTEAEKLVTALRQQCEVQVATAPK